ncbi:HK97-gp10 family putative phage morphogenesis protein [Ornithinibacillus bavariensis]|uniref:HK97-gp10 family putative phage morphogenesis protein n=1 Tax=Ornithinibacillus bavariensis TaxID=545502 RepID=UPI000ED2998C|nr:hypothetical protein [Ornithinibacillus sp.]
MARGFELRGADKLKGKLKRNANLDDVKRTVQLNGTELHRKSQRFAPVDTGFLKRQIKQYSQDNGFTAKTASEAEYSGYVNYGTRYMYPRPFMTNAYYEQRQKFIQDMKRLMK